MAPFPKDPDGNVEIYLSTSDDDKLVLSSHVLTLFSPWFKQSLSERWNTGRPPPAFPNRYKWIYELRFDKNESFGSLLKTSDGVEADTFDDRQLFDKSIDPTSLDSQALKVRFGRQAIVNAHYRVLAIIFHERKRLDGQFFDDVRPFIMDLAQIADVLGVREKVEEFVHSQLLKCEHEVLRQCMLHPVEMLELATAIRCDWIFKDAATLLIGRSDQFFRLSCDRFGQDYRYLLRLLQRRRNETYIWLRRCEFDLMLLGPRKSTSYHDVNAAHYFRDWLAEKLRDGYGSRRRNGYAKVYRMIQDRSPSADFADLQRWLDMQYNDQKAEDRKAALDEVFDRAATIIRPLLEDVTRLQDKSPDPWKSLRFVKIHDKELPWQNGEGP